MNEEQKNINQEFERMYAEKQREEAAEQALLEKIFPQGDETSLLKQHRKMVKFIA